ncbi:MAG: hypothetical protein ACUVXA_02970 [Candidatus Jordarchaeum sp.]|uniref:hypothetical protein n=1 Tax=Candidatus Jordarchaeum sp. TaxID=2823881 RepID=UPI00404A77DA
MRELITLMSEEEEFPEEELKKSVSQTIEYLTEYLKEYYPKAKGWSKHTLMGPVGKMLAIVTGQRLSNKEAITGYVINVHRNTASSDYIASTAMDNLSKGVDKLLEIREKVKTRRWLRVTKEIDYGVYKKIFEYKIKNTKKGKEETEE